MIEQMPVDISFTQGIRFRKNSVGVISGVAAE